MKTKNTQQHNCHWMILVAISCFASTLASGQVQLKTNTVLMGSTFDITVVAGDSAQARLYTGKAIEEISRIENLISEWRPGTEIWQVNENAGIRPVKVSREVFDLTKTAVRFSELTGGMFDISIAAMDRIWKFDGSMERMPTEEEIKHSIRKVGYRNIVLDSINSTIFLKEAGMKIGFGSIGKGYAADRGRNLLQSSGATGGIVNASGDLAAWGIPIGEKYWKIGVTDPFLTYKTFKVIKIKEASVVTSGDYEKYVEFDGKRYSHIINPKTGYPSTGLTSVTIIGESAEIANGLSTSIMVLGEKGGRCLMKRFPAYSALLISDKGKVTKIN